MIGHVVTIGLIVGGLFFFSVGALGLIRFPDALTRAHGAAKCDTLGAVLILAGLMVQMGWSSGSLKLFLTILFLWTTNPTATHLIARALRGKAVK